MTKDNPKKLVLTDKSRTKGFLEKLVSLRESTWRDSPNGASLIVYCNRCICIVEIPIPFLVPLQLWTAMDASFWSFCFSEKVFVIKVLVLVIWICFSFQRQWMLKWGRIILLINIKSFSQLFFIKILPQLTKLKEIVWCVA